MRIENIHIYGFGKWQDQRFNFSGSTDMIEISGNNESGKSTLRQFILYVLFGEKPANLKRYIPKQGSAIGGRIIVSDLSSQSVTIERVDGKNKNKALVFIEGEKQDEDWLQENLKGMDRAQYEAIFTFDAIDLQQIQQLDNHAIHDILIAIGMSGSDRIYQAEKKLDKSLADLFKPYGKKPEINQFFQELKELNQQLAKAKQEEATYRDQVEEINQLKTTLQDRLIEKKELTETYQQLEKQSTHYQLIKDFYFASNELKRHNKTITFPTDGLDRLNQWKEKLLPLQSEQHVIEKNIKEVEQKQTELVLLTEEEWQQLKHAVQLTEEINQITSKEKNISNQLATIRNEINEKLESMQINVTIDELEELSLPFYLEEHWAELAKQAEKIELENKYVKNDHTSNLNHISDLKNEKQQAEDKLVDSEIIENYQKQIEQADVTVEQEKQQTHFQKWQKKYEQQWKLSLIVMGIGLVSSLLLAFTTDWVWGGIIAFLAITQCLAVRVYGKTFKSWLQPDQVNSVQLTLDERQQRKKQIEEHQKQKDLIASIEKNIQHYHSEQIKLEARSTFIDEQQVQIHAKIQDQQSQYPFLTNANITYWSKLYQLLMIQKERLLSTRQLLDEVDRSRQLKKNREEERSILSVNLNQNLTETLQQEKEKRDESMRLVERLQELTNQLKECKERQQPYLDEIDQLLQHAKVENQEQFIEKGEKYHQLVETELKKNQLYDSLTVLFEEKTIQSFANGEFADENNLKLQMREVKEKLERIEQMMAKVQKDLSDRKATVDLLEKKEDVSILTHQLSYKKEKLQKLAGEWAVQKVAHAKLINAKKNYSEKYMPIVFEKASYYFKWLTVDGYPNIYINDNSKIIVENKEGFQFDVIDLSQATKDQLYIALRFALSHVMANRFALPFLIDDGFVHFDGERKEKVLELLEEISEQHQVFYFTAAKTKNAKLTLN
ncbi:ATP-binding protein [Gracilibacillus massiliensis]|uniref:ATP-binding protein n=1 Tax=Gracilibacillus massiliensis TaxID=1564956 RepID=UPI00071C443E|nr:AAA family ATPase [Gracilibacillus massiliensis]